MQALRLVVAGLLAVLMTGHAHSLAQEASGPFKGASFRTITGGGGVPLNVIEKGDASQPAILFIHGFRQSYLSWALQFNSPLAERCHLVAFDLRGHGNSGAPWSAEAYGSTRPWADDVAAVIKATGISNPLVVAWSFGGNVTMNYLRHYADAKPAGLILVDTGAGMLIPPPAPASANPAPLRPTQTPDLAVNIASVNATNELIFSKTLDPVLKGQFAAAAMRVSPFVDRGIVKLSETSNVDLLPRLTMPVTLIFGNKDPIIPAAMISSIKQFFPAARMVDFPEAGHAPFLDDPERFNALLAEHCKT